MGLRYAVTGQFDEGYSDEAATAFYDTGINYASADLADGKSDCKVPSSYSNAADLSEECSLRLRVALGVGDSPLPQMRWITLLTGHIRERPPPLSKRNTRNPRDP